MHDKTPANVDCLQFIRDDHKRIHGLLQQLKAAGQRAPEMVPGVLRELRMEIEIHTTLFEELVNPLLSASGDFRFRGWAREAVDSNREVVATLERVDERVRSAALGARDALEELEDFFGAHAALEENRILAEMSRLLEEADRLLDSDLRSSIGSAMLSRRDELMRQPKYANARPEVVQDPRGGEQKRVHSRI